MQIIYIHGFDSGSQSAKGQQVKAYCEKHHPHINVQLPDLNCSPQETLSRLSELVQNDPQTGIIGSSLGGYFATLCVQQFNLPAVLINPSTRPFDSLQRFVDDAEKGSDVIYTTTNGWQVTQQDFTELKVMYQERPAHANNILVLLKTGDEVIDYRIAKDYFSQAGAQSQLIIDHGGDHAMLDFEDKLPTVMQFLFGL